MRKVIWITFILLNSAAAQQTEFTEPVIGFDSLNRVLLNKIKFPATFIAEAQNAYIRYNIIVDSTGEALYAELLSIYPEYKVLADQILQILIKEVRWNRLKNNGLVNIRITFPDNAQKEIPIMPPNQVSKIRRGDETPILVEGGDRVYRKRDFIPSGRENARVGKGAGPVSSSKPAIKADIDASFIGGEKKFFDYVHENFKYPERCLKEGIDGSVLLQFTVDTKGKIYDVKVISETAACPEFTQEAIRVLQNSPRWMPGQTNGTFVKSYRTIPIEIKAGGN